MKRKNKQTNQYIYDIQNEPIVLSWPTLSLLLHETEKPSDCIALYTFYYYTAKYQKTNKPYALTTFTAKGLKWSEQRVRKAKKELIALGLIEDVQVKDKKTKRVKGNYIQVNFIWTSHKAKKALSSAKKKKIHPIKNAQGGTKSHPTEKPQGGKFMTNALSSIIINALSSIIGKNHDWEKFGEKNKLFIQAIENLPSELQTERIIQSIYEYFEYRKQSKKAIGTKIAVTRLTNKLNGFTEQEIIKAINVSIEYSWTGLFPKKETNGKYQSNQSKNNIDYEPENDPSSFEFYEN